MTRAEFLGKIFDCDPMDILYPIQEPTPICRYGTCACTSCEGCKSDPSYWNAEMAIDDMDNIIDLANDIRLDMECEKLDEILAYADQETMMPAT